MKNLSDAAFEIAQDINNICGKFDELQYEFEESENPISEEEYQTKLYTYYIDSTFINEIISRMRDLGYKFKRYEKQIPLFEHVYESIKDNFDITKVADLTDEDLFPLSKLASKYHAYSDLRDLTIDLTLEI